jgi:hypothetical protein
MPERDEYKPGMDLVAYAKAWIDMEPHLGHLMEFASRAKVVVEFGVRGAVSSWAILDGMAPDGTLIGVDINPECPIPERVSTDPRWTFVVGDSVKVDLPLRVDWVMIDSSHEYAQTILELYRAATLRPEYITLHDYLCAWTPEVKSAVGDWLKKNPEYLLEKVYESDYGLAVLRRA